MPKNKCDITIFLFALYCIEKRSPHRGAHTQKWTKNNAHDYKIITSDVCPFMLRVVLRKCLLNGRM